MIQLPETELLIEKTRHEEKRGEQRGLEGCLCGGGYNLGKNLTIEAVTH